VGGGGGGGGGGVAVVVVAVVAAAAAAVVVVVVVVPTTITTSADTVPGVLKNPIQLMRVSLLSSIALMYEFQHAQISHICP
jgi:hypothetical protein